MYRLHPEFRLLIEDINRNEEFGFDPDLLEAMAIRESVIIREDVHHSFPQGNPCAIRYEPDFYERYIEGKYTEAELLSKFYTTNKRRLASSYGLFQVMLTTATMVGFKGNPELLCVPNDNILMALRYLNLCRFYCKQQGLTKEMEFHMLCKYNGGHKGLPPYRKANRIYACYILHKRNEIKMEDENEKKQCSF